MRRRNASLRFEREGPLRTVGHMWQQEATGLWRRHVIRRHEESRELIFSELTFVDNDRTFCLRCLSHDVKEVRAVFPGMTPSVRVSWECQDPECGMKWWEVPEPLSLEG